VRESRTPGSVRGDRGNPVPYRVIVKMPGRAVIKFWPEPFSRLKRRPLTLIFDFRRRLP
jgi:hypothetical protein